MKLKNGKKLLVGFLFLNAFRLFGQIEVISSNQTIPGRLCDEQQITFRAPPAPPGNEYEWTIPQPAYYISTTGNEITVRFTTPGLKKISAMETDSTLHEVEIELFKTPVARLPNYYVCPEKYPAVIEGNIFLNYGFYEIYYPHLDCDSLVLYNLVDQQRVFLDFDTLICHDVPIVFDGTAYSDEGVYTAFARGNTRYLCDTIVTLFLSNTVKIAPKVECRIDSFLSGVALWWDETELAQTYQIKINGELIAEQGHTSFLYLPDVLGEDFEVVIQPANRQGCFFPEGTLTCKTLGTVSNQAIEKDEQILIRPNPSEGIFEISSEKLIHEVKVFNSSGQLIFSNFLKENIIDLSGKPIGVYFFKIKTEGGVSVKKVVKI